MSALRAEFETGGPFVLAVGYPASWLLAIAQQLKADLPTLCPATLFDNDETVTVEVVRHTDEAATDEPVNRPADTAITVDENPDGLTITIPPAGVRKGSKGLFAFSVAWCGFMVVFTGATVAGPMIKGGWTGATYQRLEL